MKLFIKLKGTFFKTSEKDNSEKEFFEKDLYINP